MDYHEIKRRGDAGRQEKSESKRGVRLAFCLTVFAAAFLVKVVAPALFARYGEQVLLTIDSSVDYRAAFTAVGNFISGEYSVGEAVSALKELGSTPTLPAQERAAEEQEVSHARGIEIARSNLQKMYLQCLDARLMRMEEAETAETMAHDGGEVRIYEIETPALPENASADRPAFPLACILPVEAPVSSAFGYRQHPIDGEEKFHYGIDLAAPEGSDILAFADGYVAASGISETAGKYLIISHGDGWTTQYFHCSEVYRTGGSEVKRGEVVAAVGQTGAATGPNLHFELLRDGVYYDPWLCFDDAD